MNLHYSFNNHALQPPSMLLNVPFIPPPPPILGDGHHPFPTSWEIGKGDDHQSHSKEEERDDDNDNDGNVVVTYRNDDGPKNNGARRHTKLCARGHWRPAEDTKLKELVAHYGPQNWNLIAENLPGRSGNTLFKHYFHS